MTLKKNLISQWRDFSPHKQVIRYVYRRTIFELDSSGFIEQGRDLEGERRRANGLQDSLKESEKEYQKLKVAQIRRHYIFLTLTETYD